MRLRRELCEIIVYPYYTDWVQGKGVPMSQAIYSQGDLATIETFINKARWITRLNGYYGCVALYNGDTVLTYINS